MSNLGNTLIHILGMLVKSYGAGVIGIDAIIVTIEVATDYGFGYSIVGLPDTAVKESGERVRSALSQLGVSFPRKQVVVNLAPADVKKEGSAYDLPLALSVLAVDEKLTSERFKDYVIMGELSLDGSVNPIKGVLPMAISARQAGFKGFIVPRANAKEAAVVNNLDVYGVDNIREAIDILEGHPTIDATIVNTREEFFNDYTTFDSDFCEVKGQENVKRALEVASAGGHNVLLVGSPGSGKSMLAKRLPSILPPLTLAESLETTKIHSVSGKLRKESTLMTQRPFRSPHHTISPVALVGGGTNPMPGEISLAHNGLLYLDEFPEFGKNVLEVLRQPLEDRCITVSRAKYSVEYPASFMLVASMNPCPCGYYTHPTKRCTCTPGAVQKYLNKISGPLLDRIDIQVEVYPVEFDKMTSAEPAELSADIRARVVGAREVQRYRFRNENGIYCNAQMSSKHITHYAEPDESGREKLRDAIVRLNMSARAYSRILKVARTIADLEYSASLPSPDDPAYNEALAKAASLPVKQEHIAEAISYRNLDRSSWGHTF